MANTVTLPPAAARSAYDLLTVRNASLTEFLEVHPNGADQFIDNPDDSIPYLVVPPHDAITLQSNEVNAWASVSSATQTGMRYRGTYVPGQVYYFGDVAVESPWTMVANKETVDSPAPAPAGDTVWQLPEAQPAGGVGRSSVYIANQFTFNLGAYVTDLRVWISSLNVDAGMTFRTLLEDRTDPNNIIQRWGSEAVGVANWNEVGLGIVPVQPGTVLRAGVLLAGKSGASGWSTPWNYLRSNANPLSGQVTHSSNGTDMLFHHLDANGTDRESLLNLMAPGDLMAASGLTWTITAVTALADHHSFTVTPATRLATEAQYTFTATYYGTATIRYGATAGYWSPQPNPLFDGEGYLQLPEQPEPGASTTGYGVDLKLVEADVSLDWDPLAYAG